MKTVLLVSVVLLVLVSGCVKETGVLTNGDGNEQLNIVSPDPCGNAIGNGNEIMSGPDIGAHSGDRDNPFRSLTVHPSNPDVILVGTESNGFIKSEDGGETWTRLRKGVRHQEFGYPEIYDIAWSRTNEDVLYAALTNGPGPVTGNHPSSSAGVYKSLDGGETWIRKNCGLPGAAVLTVHIDPTDENHAFVAIEDGTPSFTETGLSGTYFEGGMYETTDGGESWNEVELGPLDYKNTYVQIRSVRNNPSLMFASGIDDRHLSSSPENIGLIRSEDNGKTWNPIAPELGDITINYFAASGDGTTIYALSESHIHISDNEGEDWISKDMHVSALYFIAVSPLDEKRVLYGKMADIYLSEDGLETEKKVLSVERIGDKHVADIVFAPSDPNIVYLIYTGAYPSNPGYDLYRSTDAGESFSKIANLREDVLRIIP
jgi:photosystem II stability/assembly factor-like uncharacterized protein